MRLFAVLLCGNSIKTNSRMTSDPADLWATLRRKKNKTGTEVYLYSQLPSIPSALNQHSWFALFFWYWIHGCSKGPESVYQRESRMKKGRKQIERHGRNWGLYVPRLSAKKFSQFKSTHHSFFLSHLNSWGRDLRWIALFSPCLWSVNND